VSTESNVNQQATQKCRVWVSCTRFVYLTLRGGVHTCVSSVCADKTHFSTELTCTTQALPGELVLLPLNTSVVVRRPLAGTSPVSLQSNVPVNTVGPCSSYLAARFVTRCIANCLQITGKGCVCCVCGFSVKQQTSARISGYSAYGSNPELLFFSAFRWILE
jgi:hypothetical protein